MGRPLRWRLAEIERAIRLPTGDLATYDPYPRGLASWNRWTRSENARSLQLFHSAIERDPAFSTPYGLAASCHLFAKAKDWATCDEREIARLIEGAADVGIDDPIALCWAGDCAKQACRNESQGRCPTAQAPWLSRARRSISSADTSSIWSRWTSHGQTGPSAW